MAAWTLLLLSILPVPDGVIHDSVDILEENHFYDERGQLSFTQFISWDKGHPRFYKLPSTHKSVRLQQLRRGAVLTFDDDGTIRKIWSLSYSETWSQFDPEVADRDLFPVAQRRPLTQAKRR